MCFHCKKIREDSGYWTRVETYLRNHAEVEFTHGLCQDCLNTLYPGLEPSRNTTEVA